jgi:hypothetical protein
LNYYVGRVAEYKGLFQTQTASSGILLQDEPLDLVDISDISYNKEK